MANTYELISSYTVGPSGIAAVQFTSIPGTYTDLYLTVSGRLNDAINSAVITFNGSTSGYASQLLYPDGSSTGSSNGGSTGIAMYVDPSSYTANTFSNTTVYIPNYAGSTHKVTSMESTAESNGNAAMWISAGLWANTAAITSITITASSSLNFVQYSTATLHGIKNS